MMRKVPVNVVLVVEDTDVVDGKGNVSKESPKFRLQVEAVYGGDTHVVTSDPCDSVEKALAPLTGALGE